MPATATRRPKRRCGTRTVETVRHCWPGPRRSCSSPASTDRRSSAPWLVVPPPPLVRRRLRVALRRVLPLLLTPEGSDVEVVPSSPHLLVAGVVDEVGAEHAVAVAYERVRAVPRIHAEVLVEAVRDRVPRNELPAHSRLQAVDIRLRRARGERECGIAG